MQLNPYLLFNGNCEEAFNFYAKCLGGKIVAIARYEGSPMGQSVPPEWSKKVMHARLTFGDAVLMGSDPPPGHQEAMKGFQVNINLSDPTEADGVFQALAENGTVADADPEDVLGCPLRPADRSVRHALDDQLRAARGLI
jgi:PhnB protein